jgi:hypothetical protein
MQGLRRIAWSLAVIVCLQVAQAGETRTGDSNDNPPPDPNPDQEKDWTETATNPHSDNCKYEEPIADYYDCVDDAFDPQHWPTTFLDPTQQGTGFEYLPGLRILHKVDGVDEELEDLCYRENDPDIQSTYIDLNVEGLVAKIRKFQINKFSPPQGGAIIITLHTPSAQTTVEFDTEQGQTINGLNQTMEQELENAGFNVTDVGNYLVVAGAHSIVRVGFRSTDPGIIRSEIALEGGSVAYANSTACAQ